MNLNRWPSISLGSLIFLVVILGGYKLWSWYSASRDQTAITGDGRVITEAMAAGRTMECTYTDPSFDNAPATVTFQGEKFRSQTKLADDFSYAVFDGTTFYLGTDRDRYGLKMTKACLEEFKNMPPPTEGSLERGPRNPADRFAGAQNVECRKASSLDLFVPSSITFADQCELLKKSQAGEGEAHTLE